MGCTSRSWKNGKNSFDIVVGAFALDNPEVLHTVADALVPGGVSFLLDVDFSNHQRSGSLVLDFLFSAREWFRCNDPRESQQMIPPRGCLTSQEWKDVCTKQGSFDIVDTTSDGFSLNLSIQKERIWWSTDVLTPPKQRLNHVVLAFGQDMEMTLIEEVQKISSLPRREQGQTWLWVTVSDNDGTYGKVLGLSRTIRNELMFLRGLTVLVFDQDVLPEMIAVWVERFKNRAERTSQRLENEYKISANDLVSAYRYVSSLRMETKAEENEKAWSLVSSNDLRADQMQRRQVHLPQLGEHDIQVETEAVGLMFRNLLLDMKVLDRSDIGMVTLFSGRVTAAGNQVTSVKVGDPVMGAATCDPSNKVVTREARVVN